MPDQSKRIARVREDGLEQLDFILEPDRPVGPGRALACAVRIRRQDVELRREQLHQAAPLPRAARIGVQANYARSRARLAERGRHLSSTSMNANSAAPALTMLCSTPSARAYACP